MDTPVRRHMPLTQLKPTPRDPVLDSLKGEALSKTDTQKSAEVTRKNAQLRYFETSM